MDKNVYVYDKIRELIDEEVVNKLITLIIRYLGYNCENSVHPSETETHYKVEYSREKKYGIFPFSFFFEGIYYGVDYDSFSNNFFYTIKRRHKDCIIRKIVLNGKSEKNNELCIDLQNLKVEHKKEKIYILETSNVLAEKESLIEGYKKIPVFKYKKLSLDNPIIDSTTGVIYHVSKYTKCSLENKQIYFSDRKDLNDPFECSVGNAIAPECYGAFKIFSTSKKCNDILMWPYYGDSHTGVCLEYYFENIYYALVQNGYTFYIGNVMYSKKRITETLLEIYKLFFEEEFAECLFSLSVIFTKSYEWKHEEEFRFAIQGENDGKGVIVNNVDIEQLFAGYNANLTHLSEINHKIINSGKYLRIKPNPLEYKLDVK